MSYTTIEYEQRDHAVCITLNRPEVLNAINDTMIDELHEAFARTEDDAEVWTVIVTGAGRAFCTGADVSKASTSDHDDWSRGVDTQGEPMLSSMRQWDAPQGCWCGGRG